MTRDDGDRIVVGLHPVRELLRAGRPLRRILIDRDRSRTEVVAEIHELADAAGIAIEAVARSTIDQRAHGHTHQGLLAIAPAFPYVDLDHLLARAERRGEPPLLIALDGITDPHNLGAIARTAEVAGAHGLIVTRRRAASVTPSVEKAAAGALAHLPVARLPNMSHVLRTLGERDVWSVGLSVTASQSVFSCDLLTEPLVLVVGSESRGLARSSHVHCDTLVSLPVAGQLGSLNASVATGVAVYEVWRRRHGPGALGE
ncbi:MAG: 23S rRNA (guanosine(2251)-2'-O)-methyltransferase RlmB [Actinobacteria bacterium]|nr:23S rRNA (guanosine(2251)-2'-O)-methyltransferase RlmB [Actinomycetota bacterium]